MDTTDKKQKRRLTVEEIDEIIEYLLEMKAEMMGGGGASQKATANVANNKHFVEDRVAWYLNHMGVPQHIKGYKYLAYGLKMVVEEELLLESFTKSVYPLIADHYSTTPSRVERAMRHAVEVMWDRIDLEFMEELFGNTISNTKGKPTNSEFFALLSNRIRTEWMRHLESVQ